MLNLPARQHKFEQLRAYWEAVETIEHAKMLAKTEKQRLENSMHEELHSNTGSKFRRKLSNGLAYISFMPRKSMSARRLPSNASEAVSEASTVDSSLGSSDRNALLSPRENPEYMTTSSETAALLQGTDWPTETVQTPKQLPRPRTCSYIPRLIRIDGEVQSTQKLDVLRESSQDAAMTDSKPVTPTRIPTPSSTKSRSRLSSPRQYLHLNSKSHASLLPDQKANAPCITTKTALRSHTTSKLRAANVPPTANYMLPRRPGARRVSASSATQKTVLPENIPTNKTASKRPFRVQERPLKQESLAVPSAASNRTVCGAIARPTHGERTGIVSSASTKHLSNHLSPASMTSSTSARKAQKPEAKHQNGGQTITQCPESSSTPPVSKVDLTIEALAPPGLDGNDTPKRTLGTPNGLGGMWRSSKVFAAANHQVRSLPRSSTFHFFGRREAPPPVPPIPYHYKSPSTSHIAHSQGQQYIPTSLSNPRGGCRLPLKTQNSNNSSRSLLSEIASAQLYTEAASLTSISTINSGQRSDAADTPAQSIYMFSDSQPSIPQQNIALSEHQTSNGAFYTEVPRHSSYTLASVQVTSTKKSYPDYMSRSKSVPRLKHITGDIQPLRHWSTFERFYPGNANNINDIQVRDYMPPLYWAGRFQSRFDQWRTEAMRATLHPDVTPKEEGPLGKCCLDDEKKATILIFMQLRDLCSSAQAANSLHEFEYKYRKDHKMLDTLFDLPPSLRQLEDHTNEGPVGRAVRKLTPRKASFINLFKGKGWNRSDEAEGLEPAEHLRELQETTDQLSGLELTDTTTYKSGVLQHAH